MKSRAKAKSLLLNCVTYVKNQFNHNINIIRSDKGKEFNCDHLYNKLGLIHQRSCVETLQQNSVIGRKHRHI